MASQESPASTNTKAKREAKPGFSLEQCTAQGWNSGMHGTQPQRCIAISVIIQSPLTEMNTVQLNLSSRLINPEQSPNPSRPFLGNERMASGLCLNTDALTVVLSGFPDL